MTNIISMWSGPRNISTTMMRAFENRPDTSVLDEPCYGIYLEETDANHPYREETLRSYPKDLAGVADWINRAAPQNDYLFCKHIAYHINTDQIERLARGHRNFILIRDPRLMVASFANKLDDVDPIIASYRHARALRNFLHDAGAPCPIVDAADILQDPAGMLSKLCAALTMPYLPEMLAWPAGSRATDGPWAPHWYDQVERSTGFRSGSPKLAPPLPPDLAAAADAAMADYSALWNERLMSASTSN